MPCTISCMISAIFIIGMIYFYIRTETDDVVKNYADSLTPELRARYENIKKERMRISCHGYLLGLLLSAIIVMLLKRDKKNKISTLSLVCIVVATSFLTNYFYYMITPKSDWMLNHMESEEQVKNWLVMYKRMSYNYHMGLTLGIIAVGVFTFGFRK
jgi:uncharacterized protein YacL